MNRDIRLEKLQYAIKNLNEIALDYRERYPAHHMIEHALGFLNSLLILESTGADGALGILKQQEDDVHRPLKIEDGKVVSIG